MSTRSEVSGLHDSADWTSWERADGDAKPHADSLADRVLTRTADAVFVLDVRTGRAAHRWYERGRSRLDLPALTGDQQLASWVHPDDLPVVLEAFAGVVNHGESHTTFARIHPDREQPADASLLVSIRDIRDFHEDGALVQVWFLDADSTVGPDPGRARSMSSLADAAPVGLQVIAATGQATFENERFTALAKEARPLVDERVAAGVMGSTPTSEDIEAGPCSLRLRVVPTRDDDGDLVHAMVSLEDVTQMQEAEARRFLAEEQFGALFLSSPLATALVDLDGYMVRVNESFAIVTGYEIAELVGKSFQEITHPDDVAVDEDLLAEVVAGTRQNYQLEKRYVHASGHDVWVELTVAPVRDANGVVQNFVAHVEDITSRRSMVDLDESGEDLTYWATHDHLTALPNRRYLEHHLTTSLRRTRRESDRPVVMFLDLDDFKPVNDRFGHKAGDEVLRTIARRLRNACRDDALATRYGGDEFVVVSRRLRTMADVPLLSDRIQSAVRAPIEMIDLGTWLRVGVSIGIAIAREDESTDELLARADAAAYRAKREGKRPVDD